MTQGGAHEDLLAEITALREHVASQGRQIAQAHEHEAATSEILRLISSSPTDVQPVFDAIAAKAQDLCSAKTGTVFTFDGQRIHVGAAHSLSAEAVQSLRQTIPMAPSRGGATPRAILSRAIVYIRDIREDPEFRYHALAKAVGYLSALAVPMMHEGKPIGAITVTGAEAGAFSQTQIELLKTFADQAVIAIENVRLFNETKEALDRQTATAEILRVIASSPTNVQPVFDAIVRSASQLCNGHWAAAMRFDGELIHLAAQHNMQPGAAELADLFPCQPSRRLPVGRAVVDRTLVHIPDATEDLELAPEVSRRARSFLVVPMLRESVPIGAIAVSRPISGPFPPNHIELLKTFAHQAVIAIENVRLFNETKEALERQTATSEILRVIAGSPTEIQPALDVIAENAARVCGATDATIRLIEGTALRLVARFGSIPFVAPDVIPISRNYPTGVSVIERRTIHIEDILPRLETEFPSISRELRTVLATPLLREGIPIGAIVIRRAELQPFTEAQIALLQTFADQAVIAIENVRLFTELKEKNRALTEAHGQVTETLEQQTATGEILRVISSSPTDVQPVFDAIVRSASRLCGGEYAIVTRYDGQLLHLAAQYNPRPGTADETARFFPQAPRREALTPRAFVDAHLVHAPDVDAEDVESSTREFYRRIGLRAVLAVPMIHEGRPIGVVSVSRGSRGPFSDRQINLLQTFADQAVIAIENVRLFTELQARTQELTRSVGQLTALGEVGRAVSSTLELDAILQTIVSRANQLAGADSCSVFEYEEATEAFNLRASHNLDEDVVALARKTPTRKGEGVQGRMAVTREPVQVPDIAEEDAYRGPLRDVLLRSGTRAVLAIPMLCENRLIGGLTVNKRTPGEFRPEVIALLKTFATQSALAIHNAWLFREIEEKSRQLEVASQHKSEFLANMSHELRTPLNAIIGFSEVLTDRMFGELNEKQEEYLKDIYASGTHLLSLINDILDLSKIEAGRMELELTEFDLPTAIENALMLVRERAGRRSIALHTNVDKRLGQIQADERKVRQVVLNLLSNAIKFTPEGGRIEVGAVPKDGFVEVSVSDTGIGIAPEDQEKVFEEFRQVGTAAKKVEGTGLGLTLCRKFVELHGGRIWVKSEVGVGSTFTFTIPVRRRE